MRFIFFSLIFIFLQIHTVVAQEISARVLDAQTKAPIPFATVQYAPHKGVVTNEEGQFSFRASLSGTNVITVSSLGYETVEFTAENLKQRVILLKPKSIALSDVFLTNKNLSGKQIVELVKKNVMKNYEFDLTQKKFFFRESNVNSVKQFDLLVDKSTITGLDQDLINRIVDNIPKKSDSYKEILGDFYGNYDHQKIQVIKAANLHNPHSRETLDELTNKLERLFRENIKDNSYLKVRSGLFGVKMDAGDFKNDLKEETRVVEKTAEEQEKELAKKHKDLQASANGKIKSLLKTMFWKEKITLNIFEKTNRYKFKVEGYAQLDNDIVYVISFEPKRRADFKGKMYVNTVDYAVQRLEYENVKPLSKFRLLGISTIDDVYRGKMIFSRSEEGKYYPRYLERETGEGFGIDRPLTIIEKNKFVAGRRKQNELDLDIKIKVGQTSKYQLVVYENHLIEEGAFEAIKTSDDFDYQTFKVYNPDFWTGYNIIEPNAAIKAFTALEQQDF